MQAFSAVIVGRLTVLRQQRSLQKCLAHLERELKALETSRFAANREFAKASFPDASTPLGKHIGTTIKGNSIWLSYSSNAP